MNSSINSGQFLALTLFAVVSSITPGPNNTMMLASGVRFGLRRSLPHLAGISLGFGFMLAVVGLGLHAVLHNYPVILDTLRYAGAAYLLWLAYQLARSAPPAAQTDGAARPMGFWAAAAFQWVNPKAWIMATTAMTTYLPENAQVWHVLVLSAWFALINVPCVGAWASFGNAMRAYLQNPAHLRIFNITMALALVASLFPMLANG
jgi:threonine/homoserine/homoserine lactone efflux protein